MIDCEPLSGNRWQLEPICSAETLLISPDNSSESDWDRTSNSNLSQSSTLSSYNNIWEAFSVIQYGEEHEKEGGGGGEFGANKLVLDNTYSWDGEQWRMWRSSLRSTQSLEILSYHLRFSWSHLKDLDWLWTKTENTWWRLHAVLFPCIFFTDQVWERRGYRSVRKNATNIAWQFFW